MAIGFVIKRLCWGEAVEAGRRGHTSRVGVLNVPHYLLRLSRIKGCDVHCPLSTTQAVEHGWSRALSDS